MKKLLVARSVLFTKTEITLEILGRRVFDRENYARVTVGRTVNVFRKVNAVFGNRSERTGRNPVLVDSSPC